MTANTTAPAHSAGDPLAAYVAEHAARALEGVRRLSGPMPVELVHATRTSLRRLRATLRTLPDACTEAIATDADLRHVALAFGEVRDLDVLSQVLVPLADEAAAQPASLRDGLVEELRARRLLTLDRLTAAAQQAPWGRTVAQLEHWSLSPPALPPTDTGAVLEEARALVRERIEYSGGDPEALHRARKAAKRWRYAAEMLVPVEPSAAEHLTEAEPVQEVLGALQDTVMARSFLAASTASPATPSESLGEALELLDPRLRARQEELTAQALDVLGVSSRLGAGHGVRP